ncbi:MAG: phage tail protein [Sphingobium yanoikuyae]|nr:phage tail protein [Sphingobium yanoikuyae]
MGKTITAITGVVMIGVGIATGNVALIAQGVMTVATVLLAPSMKARTASKNTLTIGETAREGIFGEGSTGGSLVDIFNYGGKYGTDWTVAIYALADHRCDALTGFYVQDKWVPFTGNGLVAGYKNQLRVDWRPGAWDDDVPAWVLANCPVVDGVPTWTANDRGRGVAKVYVAWKADKSDAKNPVWTSGSPWSSFLWIVKGLRCYQARKDSSIGGSGAHRWDDPTTREWTENPIDCRYTWARGIYAGDHVDDPAMLLLGRGLTDIEAPPENVFAPANVCDEPVALKDGGTEPRYRIGGVFGGDDKYIDTDDDIASACGGYTVEREGSIEIVPGSAQPVVWDITDDDLVVGSTVSSSDFRTQTDDEWVNTVAVKYIEPTQQWKDHSAPVRRNTADILADGEPKVAQPALTLCKSGTQAQRIGEMKRRMGRLWRTRSLTLPPRLVGVEHGDWIRWTSKRYGVRPIPDEPVSIVYRVESDSQDRGWQNQLTLREINAEVYGWTIADELADGSAAVDNPEPDFGGAPDAGDWTFAAAGTGGTPTLRFVGSAGSDAVTQIYFEYAASASAPDAEDDAAWTAAGATTGTATEFVAGGVAPNATYWGAVSYQIDAARSDRLVIGPVTTGTVTASSAETAADADQLGGSYGASDITNILDRLSAAGIP